MKLSQKKVVDFYKETNSSFNVYVFNPVTKKRVFSIIACDLIRAMQEILKASSNGYLVLCIDDEGEKEAGIWEFANRDRVSFSFCQKFAVKITGDKPILVRNK